ncbi:hypothetical protein OHB54_45005 [Streptomyces sp. NBC_01007]|nr:hypothetical protein OHB54_45005 [Streptomyces sp. NBC_01007]
MSTFIGTVPVVSGVVCRPLGQGLFIEAAWYGNVFHRVWPVVRLDSNSRMMRRGEILEAPYVFFSLLFSFNGSASGSAVEMEGLSVNEEISLI